ncbi:uncharacterized protein [Ptychodera flava]|uniref:uncharacterized protein isoform X2 n=1 Tax=Ptychodera flava TaxID=63121 RepID=UPI00396A839F
MADVRRRGILFWLCIFVLSDVQRDQFAISVEAEDRLYVGNNIGDNFIQEKPKRAPNIQLQRSVDLFKDFYADDGYSRQNFKVDREDSFIPDQKEDDSLLKGKKPPPDKDEITLMNRLWTTLRIGNLPKKERPTSGYVPGYSYKDHIREHSYLNSGSYLEIGTGITAYHLSTLNITESTIAAIVMPDTYLPQLSKYSEHLNLFLHSMDLENLSNVFEELQYDYQVMFGTILLSNLTALIGDNLPHEYEELLAKIISMARYTLVSHANTKDANAESYFHNWESISELLRSSCDIGGLECEVSVAQTTPFWKPDDDSQLSLVSLKSAQRILPADLCNDIEQGKKCSLVYIKNATDDLTIQYEDEDDSYTLPPTRPHSIPLNTLLKLGPTRGTKEHLLHQFLQLPYRRQISTHTLHVLPHRMLLSLPEDEELFIDRHREAEKLHAWIDGTLKLDHIPGESPKKVSVPKKKKMVEIKNEEDALIAEEQRLIFEEDLRAKGIKGQDVFHLAGQEVKVAGSKDFQRRVVRSEDMETEDLGDYLEQQETQLDGVAQMWDRENIPKFVHQKNHLQKLNEHWERDQEEGDDGDVDRQLEYADPELEGVEKMLVRDIDKDENRDEVMNNGDDELTKDEEDLMKAMKILADDGKSDGKEVNFERERVDGGFGRFDEGHEAIEDRVVVHRDDDIEPVIKAGADDGIRLLDAAADGMPDYMDGHQIEDNDVPVNFAHHMEAEDFQQAKNVPVNFAHHVEAEGLQHGEQNMNENIEGHRLNEQLQQDQKFVQIQHNDIQQMPKKRIIPGGHQLNEDIQHEQNGIQIEQGHHLHDQVIQQMPKKTIPQHRVNDDAVEHVNKEVILYENAAPETKRNNPQENSKKQQKRKSTERRGEKLSPMTDAKINQNKKVLKIPKRTDEGQAPRTKIKEDSKMNNFEIKNVQNKGAGVVSMDQKLKNHQEDQAEYRKAKKSRLKDKLLGRYPGVNEAKDKVDNDNLDALVKLPQRRLLNVDEGVDENEEGDQKNYVQKLLDLCALKCKATGSTANDGQMTMMPTLDSDPGKVDTTHFATDMTPYVDPMDDEPMDDLSTLDRLRHRKQKSWDSHRSELLFDREWRVLKKYFNNPKLEENFSFLTYGVEQQSLMGAKVARMFPNSTVITVIPPSLAKVVEKHRKLQDSLQFQNNLLMLRQVTSELIHTLHKLPQLFKFQVIGLTIFDQIVSVGHNFLKFLGNVLSMAEMTFIEVPSPAQLIIADIIFGNHSGFRENGPAVFKGMVFEALKFANIQNAHVEIIDDTRPSRRMASLKLLKVEIKSLKREVFVDCHNNTGDLTLGVNDHVTIRSHVSVDQSPTSFKRAKKAVGLETLLAIGLQSTERMTLFKSYLLLPQHKDMCPFNIVWYQDKLIYNTVLSSADLSVDRKTEQMERKALLQLIHQQLDQNPFSFMQYNSRDDDILLTLASKYPNSTFISMLDNSEDAEDIFQKVKSRNLSNTLVTALVTGIDESFAWKLVESPEFLRYQFIDIFQFFEMIESPETRESFNQMLGAIIASGVTTFIQMPSAETLSMAYSIFFPDAYDGQGKSQEVRYEQYMHENHPYPFYRNAEVKIIHESAQANGNVTVSSKIWYPSYSPPETDYSWKLLRIDVRNLSTTVDHHFDYALDGHQRKYTLHCVSNEKSYRVYLVRNKDGFVIPYGNVNGVSVIALLRMGLLSELKDHFYNMFVHMPLYEDMAPWNIIFRAGKLEYIDYDTKDLTLTHMVPAAYQVMSMLMNYERTVRDFGRCNSQSSNPYNFPYISNCVGSDFSGPCYDPKYPVPCGDHTCRSTYVECLRALSDLELKKNGGKTSISDAIMPKENEDSKNFKMLTSEELNLMSWTMTKNYNR